MTPGSFAIARNTFKETIRDRVLSVIVVFALVMIVASLWLASISLEQQGRMMKDFGLLRSPSSAWWWRCSSAASLVRKEMDKRTVFVLFSKPVGRGQFIVGKFLGLGLTSRRGDGHGRLPVPRRRGLAGDAGAGPARSSR